MNENYLKRELYDLIKNDSTIFDFIQAGSLDGIWYWDLENMENEWMSPKFWKTLGYSFRDKQHLSREWQNIIFPEDFELAKINLKKHLDDPSYDYDQIVRYRHRKGHTVWIRCKGLAIRNEEGTPIRMIGAHIDITEIKQAEKKIEQLSQEYSRIFNGTQDAMFLIEYLAPGKFRFIRNNKAHQLKTGISLEQFRDKTPQELLGDELGDIVSENYQGCIEAGEPITYEEELELPGGSRVWRTTLTPILDECEKWYVVGSANDITEQKKLESELHKMANYDKLTKLANRRLFFEKLDRLIFQSKSGDVKFSLLFIDLDGFKSINDDYGHKAGDKVLVAVANHLKECLRDSDIVARIGGDEFTVIVNNTDSKTALTKVVEKIQRSLKEPIEVDGYSCFIGASVGIAIYPQDGDTRDEIIKNADTAMYYIKKNGKGGYAFFDTILTEH